MNLDQRTIEIQGNPAQENLQRTVNQRNDVPIAYQDDWQEELYQKIKRMNESYGTDLRMLYQFLSKKIVNDALGLRLVLSSFTKPQFTNHKCQKLFLDHREAPNAINMDTAMKLKKKLECMLALFQLSKHSMTQGLKQKMPIFEENINLVMKARYKHRPHAGESSSSANQVTGVKTGNKRGTSAEPIRQVKLRLCRVCGSCAHNKRGQ